MLNQFIVARNGWSKFCYEKKFFHCFFFVIYSPDKIFKGVHSRRLFRYFREIVDLWCLRINIKDHQGATVFMMEQTKINYSQLFEAHFIGPQAFAKFLVIASFLFITPLIAVSQEVRSSQTNKQKVPVVVPSTAVDDTVSLVEGKVVIVYDGDTVGIEGKDFKFYSIRIHGIDAPEDGQGFGREARKKLVDMIEGKDVRVVVVKKGEFDRYMGTLYCDGTDVGLMQVKNGYAWHLKQLGYEQNSEDRRKYSAAEKKARADKLGLWSANAPIPPWEFRGETETKIEPKKSVASVKKAATATAAATPANAKTKNAPQTSASEGVKNEETGRTYFLGPRGGCYYVSDSGRKVYVKDKSLCEPSNQ